MIETDVLIIGTGPAGGAAAALLATYGVKPLVVTKWNWTCRTPRAHITNQRAMEVFRDLGIEDEVNEKRTAQQYMGNNVFCTSLAGEELGRLLTWGTHPQRKADYTLASPTTICDVPQNLLEPILVGAAASRGATVMFNWEYQGLDQDADGVTVEVKDYVAGTTHKIRAKYVIGADGGRSKVAEDIGLPMEGKMGVAGSMNIVFEADLSKYVAHRPSVLYWVMQPGSDVGGIGMGLVRMVRPWHEWLIVWGYDINQPPPKVTDEMATEIAHNLIGDHTIPIKIKSTSVWTVNNMYALAHSKGRVFCCRRCRSSASAVQWPRLQHLDPGLVQPRLEARLCAEGQSRRRRCWKATAPSGRRSPSRSSPAPTSRSANSGRSSRRSACCRPRTRMR